MTQNLEKVTQNEIPSAQIPDFYNYGQPEGSIKDFKIPSSNVVNYTFVQKVKRDRIQHIYEKKQDVYYVFIRETIQAEEYPEHFLSRSEVFQKTFLYMLSRVTIAGGILGGCYASAFSLFNESFIIVLALFGLGLIFGLIYGFILGLLAGILMASVRSLIFYTLKETNIAFYHLTTAFVKLLPVLIFSFLTNLGENSSSSKSEFYDNIPKIIAGITILVFSQILIVKQAFKKA